MHPGSRVVSIEPNEANLERLGQNLQRNNDLASQLLILPVAISDHEGSATLVASDDVESGVSSCSFLAGGHPPFEGDTYLRFTGQPVSVRTIDGLAADSGIPSPHVIKVDDEGGERLVLKGAAHVLSVVRPMWLIEVHTIGLMADVHTILGDAGYRVCVLAEPTPSRCLISAVPERRDQPS
jgi:FkbM family methyltransferase